MGSPPFKFAKLVFGAERMVVLRQRENLLRDTKGDAVVEATILFPIIIMIFAALVLLSMYLPTRAGLQMATQYAATAIATEQSDTWLRYDEEEMEYYWVTDKSDLPNVYSAVFSALIGGGGGDAAKAETIVEKTEDKRIIKPTGELTVEYGVVNYVVYKEIIVTATRTVKMPVNLSFIGFPSQIPVTVTSTAVVQNGDEFIRNMDLAAEIATGLYDEYIADTGIGKLFTSIGEVVGKGYDLLGV